MPNQTHHVDPLEIQLESSELVFRGFTGDEASWTPAVCNGSVILNLAHSTDLREVSLVFTGVAKVTWRDSSTHHHDHPLFFHDFNFLNPSSHTNREDAKKEHHHVHTLKAGRHVFPFSLTVPGSLPASLRTYSGTGVIEYKLKAIAQRPGFAATDWKARKMVRIARSFGADAVEYNQTLEIENTWPGKVMYSFTLPHKAYAAGDTIPVAVKFSPLAKGVRIVSLITTIREHTTVYSKNSSHSEARDATVVKYNFVEDGGAPQASGSGANTPHHQPPRIESTASLRSMGGWASGMSTPTTPGFNTPFHGGAQTPAVESPSGSAHGFPFRPPPGRRPKFQIGLEAAEGTDEDDDDESTEEQQSAEEEEIDDGQDTEVDVVVDVQIPIWTAPSHTVHPIFVNHKIKWSAFIKNPDGHVSELRCALPIHILASCLQEEARLASAGSRNLLFGESGVLAHSDVPQVDLPSYQDHVRDRLANSETAAQHSASAGFVPTPWSARTTPTGTPGISPPASRPPSRPPSPERRSSQHSLHFGGFGGFSSLSSINHSGPKRGGLSASTPLQTPSPATPEPESTTSPEDHRNWVDSELLSTLALSDHVPTPTHSNPASRPGSRPTSRPSSRPNSRPQSRAASPERGPSAPMAMSSSPAPSAPISDERPALSKSHTGGGSFFGNMHFPKPLRPLTGFSRNSSASNLRDMLHMSGSHSEERPSQSRRGSLHASRHDDDEHSVAPSPSALSSALAAHAARAGPSGQVPRQPSYMDAPQASTAVGGGGAQIHTHPLMSNSPSHVSATASPISASPAAASSPLQTPGFTQNYGTTTPLSLSIPPTPAGVITPHSGPTTPAPQPAGDVDLLSQVPSYDVAARGFLGGGVVPLSRGLPNYDDICPSPAGSSKEGEGRSVDEAEGGGSATDFADASTLSTANARQ